MCFVLLLLSTAIASPPTAKEVEAMALAQRLSIRTIDIRYTTVESDPPRGKSVSTENHIWFDRPNERLRVERTILAPPDAPEHVRARTIWCQNCERRGWGIAAYDMKKMAVIFEPAADNKFKSGIRMELRDPTLFGYFPTSYTVLGLDRLDKFVGGGGRANLRMIPETTDGVECLRIDSDGPGEQRDSIWIAPSLGHTVVRMVHEAFPGQIKPTRWTCVSTGIAAVGTSGVYFPKTITWVHFDNAGGVSLKETLEVEAVAINDPIPDAVFTLAGLGLSEGAYVQHGERRLSGNLVGGKIVPPPRERVRDFTDEEADKPVAVGADGLPVRPENRWWLYLSVVLAVTAFAVAVYRWRTRRG